MDMDAHYAEYLGLALFVASEIIGMSKLRSNTVLQLLLSAAMRAFPFAPSQKETSGPLDIIFGVKNRDRR